MNHANISHQSNWAFNLLTTAEEKLQSGHHHASNLDLTKFERLNTSSVVRLDDARINAEILVKKGRNFIHLGEYENAMRCFDAIDQQVISISKTVAALTFLNTGIIKKRIAYVLWKKGDKESALCELKTSISLFHSAQYEAHIGGLGLIQFNSELNQLYAQNLQSWITGNPRTDSMSLAKKTVVCLYNIHQNSPPIASDDLTGLIILADICAGIKVSPKDLFNVSNDASFQHACKSMFDINGTWSENLLAHCAGKNNRHDSQAKGLCLGAKLLQENEQELHARYQILLLDSLLKLQKDTQRESFLTSNLREQIQILSVKSKKVIDIRVFR
jgi:tetratricopeptide (TPR) repeat protein